MENFRAHAFHIRQHPKKKQIIADIQAAIDTHEHCVSVRFVGDWMHPNTAHYEQCATLGWEDFYTSDYVWEYVDPVQLLALINKS